LHHENVLFERSIAMAEKQLSSSFPITVDYAKSLAEMIAAGKYPYWNECITAENFPIMGEGSVNTEIVLVHFYRDNIEADDAVKELEQMGLRPATLPELLAFGAQYPDAQRESPIIALGSVCALSGGVRHVPCLDYWQDRHELSLHYWDAGWNDIYRFAAVPASA
jgi:hypothetical protein